MNENAHHEAISSGENNTFWLDSGPALQFDALKGNAQTDVVIVGAGISGLTTAYTLLKAGKKVIVADDGFIGSGETGRTTAHLTCALDDRYYELESIFGKETAALAAESHMEAIRFIENLVNSENIQCRFKWVDGYLFSHPTDKEHNLDKEFIALQNTAIGTDWVTEVPGMPKINRAIRFSGQAQFHIMEYLNGLAKAIVKLGGEIYSKTKVTDIDKNGVKANGHTIKANHIVVATNSPINDIFTMHTKQSAYRSYVIAGKVEKGKLPYKLWWDTGDQHSKSLAYHYARLEENDGYDLLIVGGEDFKTGQVDHITDAQRYQNLEEWTRQHFPDMEDITYRWSGQVMEPVDALAFIGRNPGDENIYIITGDSGNGMTHGTLGGIIIGDLISGKENRYETIYSPSRITLNTAKSFLEENINVAAQYLDWLAPGDIALAESIPPGEGAVIASGMSRYAVYRDQNKKLHAFDAFCPHLGCVVKWNTDEKSWDCPCHGSRFSKEGIVINGPAISDLKKISPSKL